MDTVTTKIISKDILDPFEVITEEALYDLILQHLSGKEIIELSTSNDVLDVTFDKLDDLKIMGLNKFIVNCFTTAPVLKSLSIMFTMMSHDELIKFIDISEKLKLSLKSLIVQKASEGRTIIDENFEIFLKTQMRTLEDIEFHDVADAETLNFIFKELRMKKLTVNRIDEPNQLNPRMNAHITELVIKSDSKCSSLILASPNLHKLHVQRMNKSLLEFLCRNPNLRTVTFCQKEDDIETIEELYRSLSNDSANIYNEAIQFIQT
ncbi:CLUMA_CG008422, isoform A [Clunio marinus]|uniref:CLUMA_CG008422, isoform A n=1 Tax=Clunio marinus TaxID=568069 RepID=A0A1J1I410_9DIPT|nr:CLUMA_CG008422, isoform A [Clunio marinus]